ncbi:hypothetical protein QYE76_002364 [Lolium multiflorum]|uniref:C2H2-type domain-containing protein n=1 Tax=Lolium multiflorum TaxID=4521 RepID=A0AAD8RN20_LOLMU|nr:hypothetical protein QYE76_002364 [Lolium multiflorum]
MDRHTCKLCFRRFQNGRALGGHMRSHVMAAAAAAATAAAYSPPQQRQSPPVSFASTSSTDIDGKLTQPSRLSCVMREDPRRNCKVGAHVFSGAVVAGESSVVQDGESDTESPRVGAGFGVCRRRSKRARRRAPLSDPEPASSVSDATREEDVAMSLVMLSRDSWTRSRSEPEEPHWARASWEAEQNDSRVNLLDEEEYDGKATAARPRGRHQCGACRKVFRSYQALGGHRASVKKGKGGCVPVPLSVADAPVAVHECPFCFRVFGSGQALGGHKRAHMPFGGAGAPSPAKCGDSFGSFDLNVPVAFDDDFELSAVYDAEFGSTRQ